MLRRRIDWQDKFEARQIIRLGAPAGHAPAPCSCRRGAPRECFGVCEDLVDAIARALVCRGGFSSYHPDDMDDEIPF